MASRLTKLCFAAPGIRLENQANEGHAAMAGQGFALLTPLLWKGDVAAGRLAVPFPDRVSARGWAYWLVYPRERRMVPKVKRFREWLLPEMQASLDILTNSPGQRRWQRRRNKSAGRNSLSCCRLAGICRGQLQLPFGFPLDNKKLTKHLASHPDSMLGCRFAAV